MRTTNGRCNVLLTEPPENLTAGEDITLVIHCWGFYSNVRTQSLWQESKELEKQSLLSLLPDLSGVAKPPERNTNQQTKGLWPGCPHMNYISPFLCRPNLFWGKNIARCVCRCVSEVTASVPLDPPPCLCCTSSERESWCAWADATSPPRVSLLYGTCRALNASLASSSTLCRSQLWRQELWRAQNVLLVTASKGSTQPKTKKHKPTGDEGQM